MINYLHTIMQVCMDLIQSPLIIFLVIFIPLFLWWVFVVEKRDGFNLHREDEDQ